MRKSTIFISLLLLFTLFSGLLTGCGTDEDYDDYYDDPEISLESTDSLDYEDEEIYDTESETDEYESEDGDTSVDEETDSGQTNQTSNTDYSNNNSAPGTWLVMLYQDADDNVLEEDIFTDLNEAERVGSSENVTIVAQIDRYDGDFDGDGDWTDTRRYYLTQDDDLESIHSEQVGNLGELNMADGETLVDFVTWAVQTYPAGHYVLILSDHGTGWPGGWSDPDPENDPDAETISGFSDMLYLNEIIDALNQIQQTTGVEKFDLIGMDACLMGSLEVFQALEPFANFAVASQETEPAMGWAYTAIMQTLTENPQMSGGQLAKLIVDTYIDSDALVVDDEARSKFVERMYESSDPVEPEALAAEMGKDVTLTAVDLAKIPAVVDAVNEMSQIMADGINQKVIARARTHAQSFESVFGDDSPSPYIDLGHFAKLLKKETTSTRLQESTDTLRSTIEDAIVAEKHGMDKKGATGISIYFPNSDLYEGEGSDYQTYQTVANSFVQVALWDEFLAYHYTGETLTEGSAPQPASRVVAPGASESTISPLELSADVSTDGEAITITTTIEAEAIGYIYIFTGYIDPDSGKIQVIDIDYLDSETTQEVDGIIYPYWGEEEGPVELEFDWEPIQYVILDDQGETQALLEPDTYGESLEDTIYTVSGIYTFSSGGERYARLYFNGDGDMFQVFGYAGENGTGAVSEIIPEDGDTFTILDRWIEGEGDTTNFVNYAGGTLVFGNTRFTWDSSGAPAGEYVVGIMVEDLDGNRYEEYTSVVVE